MYGDALVHTLFFFYLSTRLKNKEKLVKMATRVGRGGLCHDCVGGPQETLVRGMETE